MSGGSKKTAKFYAIIKGKCPQRRRGDILAAPFWV